MTRRSDKRGGAGSAVPAMASAPPSESLDDFPAALHDDPMPWETPRPELIVWPWGVESGKALTRFGSEDLLAKRRRLAQHGKHYEYLIEEIDRILTERGGE